jgi:hypothetical protein
MIVRYIATILILLAVGDSQKYPKKKQNWLELQPMLNGQILSIYKTYSNKSDVKYICAYNDVTII